MTRLLRTDDLARLLRTDDLARVLRDLAPSLGQWGAKRLALDILQADWEPGVEAPGRLAEREWRAQAARGAYGL